MNIFQKIVFGLLIPILVSAPFADETTVAKRPLIQMAILLDTSGSMDGLIDQAKSQLWKIVNEFIAAKKNDLRPEIQVALYEYGKQSISAEEDYLRMVLPLTTDLDKVSEELFALKTNGGDEYCGRVIQAATKGLAWSTSNDDLKVIFIAGNEPFTQGAFDYKQACAEAIAKGIIVNTIFCGPHQEGIDTFWKHGADLSDGMYVNIDQNQQVVHIASPQDAEIETLGRQLNTTYIAYGANGDENQKRQELQDSNALGLSADVMLQRSICKSSGNYWNSSWDLVDALTEGKKLEEIKEEALPEEMKKMTLEERKSFVEQKAKERVDIQKRIQELNQAREKYVAEKQKELIEASGQSTFDQAMIQILRSQASKKSFQW